MLNTYWHSEYDPNGTVLPQELVLDLGHPANVEGLSYLPRMEEDANGTIADCDVDVSDDGENWTKVVEGTVERQEGQKVEEA